AGRGGRRLVPDLAAGALRPVGPGAGGRPAGAVREGAGDHLAPLRRLPQHHAVRRAVPAGAERGGARDPCPDPGGRPPHQGARRGGDHAVCQPHQHDRRGARRGGALGGPGRPREVIHVEGELVTGDKPPGDRPGGKGPVDPRVSAERLEEARRVIQGWAAKIVGSLERAVTGLRDEAGEVRQTSAEMARSLASWLSRSLEAARATPQAGRLGREIAAVYGAYRWLEVRVRSMSPDQARAEREGFEGRSAARIAAALGDLRRPAIRIAQLAGARRDALPPGWITALALVRGPVPPIDHAAVAARVRDELGGAFDARIASIEEQPLVAGELFQVHGAALRDGTRVALKVPVPGAAELVEGGLSLVTLVAGAPGIRPPGIDLRPLAADVSRAIREELDLELEADRLRRMATDLAGEPAVHVPRVLGDLSTARLLTTERIDGERLADHLDRARAGGEGGAAARDRALATLVRAVAALVFKLGRVHPDPAAAFVVEPDGRLAFVDLTGLTVLSRDARRASSAPAAPVLDRDRDRPAAALADLGLRDADDERTAAADDERTAAADDERTAAADDERTAAADDERTAAADDERTAA